MTSNGDPTPLYHQLKTLLIQEILDGRYSPELRLPTEHELCHRLGVSRNPVTRALSDLAAEGVVIRRRRLGTFVDPAWLARHQTDKPELRVLIPDGGPWADYLQQAAADSYRLVVESVPFTGLHAAFVRSVAEGRAPDLALLDSVWISEFTERDVLVPLDELAPAWAESALADLLPPFNNGHRFDGHLLAVQAEMDIGGLWYRRTALAAIDEPPPTTWRDVARVGAKLRALDPSHDPLVMPAGPRSGEQTTYCCASLLASAGAAIVLDDHVAVGTDAAVSVLTNLRGLVDDGILPSQTAELGSDGAISALGHGLANLALGGSYDKLLLAQVAGVPVSAVSDEFGFVPMPSSTSRGGVLVGGLAYCVTRQARQPNHAISLLRDAVAADRLIELCSRTGHVPPRRSAAERLEAASSFHSDSVALLAQATARPVTPFYALVSRQVQTMVHDVVTRRCAPDVAAARAADRISAITGLPVAE